MTVVMTNLLLFDAFCVTNTHENRMMHSHENCVTSAYEKHVTGWLEETELKMPAAVAEHCAVTLKGRR